MEQEKKEMIRDTYFFVFEVIGYDQKKRTLHGEFVIEEPMSYDVIKEIEKEMLRELEVSDVTVTNFIKF